MFRKIFIDGNNIELITLPTPFSHRLKCLKTFTFFHNHHCTRGDQHWENSLIISSMISEIYLSRKTTHAARKFSRVQSRCFCFLPVFPENESRGHLLYVATPTLLHHFTKSPFETALTTLISPFYNKYHRLNWSPPHTLRHSFLFFYQFMSFSYCFYLYSFCCFANKVLSSSSLQRSR